MASAEDVLTFWFGQLSPDGRANAEKTKAWWTKDPAFDEEIRARFETDYEAIVAKERRDWSDSPRGRLATIIVLDQFARNMFRGTPKMFAADKLAASTSAGGIDAGADRKLGLDERVFFYMPLMHSEDLAIQNRCVEVFATFADELSGEARSRVQNNHDYAIRHRNIVADWGRFPHRNAVLGRQSTPQELEFLKQPGSSF